MLKFIKRLDKLIQQIAPWRLESNTMLTLPWPKEKSQAIYEFIESTNNETYKDNPFIRCNKIDLSSQLEKQFSESTNSKKK